MFTHLNLNSFLKPKHEHRWLALMLISLHSILWWDFFPVPLSDSLLRFVLFLHFATFLLWQVLWNFIPKFQSVEKRFQSDYTYYIRYLVLFSIVISIFTLFPNIWLISLWQLILIALMGGRTLRKSRDRIINLLAILFLSVELFLINLPLLFAIEEVTLLYQFSPKILSILNYGLLSFPLMFLFISKTEPREYPDYVVFFNGLAVLMLIISIALGSLVIVSHSSIIWPLAIFKISSLILLILLILSLLWIAFAREDGVEQLWMQHLHIIGSAFELWLENITQPINHKTLTPQEFLHSGFEQLLTLPWVSGIAWQSLYGEDMIGKPDRQEVIIEVQSIQVTIYSHKRISSNNYFQINILIKVLEHFHQAKRRQAAFAQQVHLQVIHETGAKLTHDIKNLLQSLHAITSVIENSPPNKFGETQRLLQGQMPHLTQRLKRTLDKLQKPTEFSYSHVPVNLWWSNLTARYRKSKIEFSSQIETDNRLIPEDLFDNLLENILQNALNKRKREPTLKISVLLIVNKRGLQLSVCDDGSAIPEKIAQQLFNEPVASRDGFGIGLYQAVKQLAHTGYQLNLGENVEGEVCFELVSIEE
jgi:signal transduction histidine kinase